MACVPASLPLGQHASPREISAKPPTRPTAMPPPVRPTPKSTRATKPGSAIKAIPVAASSAEDSTTSTLVVAICQVLYSSMFCSLRPLFEHLLDGFFYCLLVLVAVVAQGILAHTAPDKRLLLRVIDADDQCSLDILLGSDPAHAATDAPHAPGAVGGLLSQAARRDDDQVWICAYVNLAEAFSRESAVGVADRDLRQDGIGYFVWILDLPCVGMELCEALAVVVVD